MKFILIFITISIYAFARENPFVPTNGYNYEDDIVTLINLKKKPKVVSKPPLITPIVDNKPSSSKRSIIQIAKTPNIPTKIIENKPIILEEYPKELIIDCCIVKEKKRVKNSKKRKIVKKYNHTQTLYKNYFLKILKINNRIKIYNCDKLISKKFDKKGKKLILDFKKIQYFKSVSRRIESSKFSHIKIGSHHCFYRVVIYFKDKTPLLLKSSYGYLIY